MYCLAFCRISLDTMSFRVVLLRYTVSTLPYLFFSPREAGAVLCSNEFSTLTALDIE